MSCWILLSAISLAVPSNGAGEITGQYIEARTCEVFTGPCFANADTGLTGRNAVMAWKVEHGTRDSVRLDGLGIVAIVSTSETLGLTQTGSSRAVLIVDA